LRSYLEISSLLASIDQIDPGQCQLGSNCLRPVSYFHSI